MALLAGTHGCDIADPEGWVKHGGQDGRASYNKDWSYLLTSLVPTVSDLLSLVGMWPLVTSSTRHRSTLSGEEHRCTPLWSE